MLLRYCLLLCLAAIHLTGHAQGADAASIWRAASRLGYAPTPAIVEAIRQHPQGARGWALDQIDQAYAASQQTPSLPEELASFAQPLPVLAEEYRKERVARAAGQPNEVAERFARTASQNAAAWRLFMCSNPNIEPPLLARLTEFWFNHFNVFSGKGSVRPFVGHYVVNAIRRNALGSFEALVYHTARHPAMLFYLDQAQSVAEGTPGARGQIRGLNENYARELLELHTLGVQGGYTQHDVRELARVLTGWTIDPGAEDGFRFAPRLHDSGTKIVLGRAFSDQGETEGRDAIAMLTRHPATAQRIALRLAQWFVSDDPPPALVKTLADEFLRSQGDLRSVLRSLINSDAFWSPTQVLFKTPFDYACSALVATGPHTTTGPRIGIALRYLAAVGQPVHGWQTPDGYKTSAGTWLAPEALTRRADLAYALTDNNSHVEMLQDFLSQTTRSRIPREPGRARAALTLASPDFMTK